MRNPIPQIFRTYSGDLFSAVVWLCCTAFLIYLFTPALVVAPQLKAPDLSQQSQSARLTLDSPHNELKELRINTNLILAHAEEFKSLTNLKLLIINNKELTPELFQTIATIPNLCYLVIRNKAAFEDSEQDLLELNPAKTDLPASCIQPFENHKTIEGIFADWSETCLLPSQYPTLVFPSFVKQYKHRIVYFTWFAIALTSLTIAAHNHTLFDRAQARLIPRYIMPHFQVAAYILSAISFLCALRLMMTGTPFFTSLAIVLIPASYHALIQLFSLPKNLPIYLTLFPMQYLPIYTITQVNKREWGITNNLLEGHFEYLAPLPLVAQIAFISLAFYWKSQRLGFTPVKWRWPRFFTTTNSSYEPAIRRPKLARPRYARSIPQQLFLWRNGNDAKARMFFILLACLILFLYLLQTTINDFGTDGFAIIPFFLFLASPVVSSFSATAWQDRLRTLPMESLRPASRIQLTHRLIAAISIDYLYWILLTFFLFILGYSLPSSHATTTRMFFALPLITAATLLLWSIHLALFTEPKAIHKLVMIVIAIIFVIFSFTLLPDRNDDYRQHLQLMLLLMAFSALFSTLIAYGGYKNLLNHEWGNPKT